MSIDVKRRQRLKERRKKRIRKKIFGTDERPRLTVFRSNRFIYAQIINDEKGETLVGASEKELGKIEVKGKKEVARKVGELLAKKASTKKIKEVVFDRGGFSYTGCIKALAEGARNGGLKF